MLGSGAATLGLALPGCDSPPPERYAQADIELLARQRALEEQSRGRGLYGRHVYPGYRGLAQLPWFDLDANGALRCTDEEVPYSIDVHCHLGMSVLFRPHLDLLATTPRVKHLLDCDGSTPGCPLDLDTYINGNFSRQALDYLTTGTIAQGLWGSESAKTQTIPNLLREMDAMRVQHAMLLPIKLGLPFGDQLFEDWHAAVHTANEAQRLHVGFSTHPHADDASGKNAPRGGSGRARHQTAPYRSAILSRRAGADGPLRRGTNLGLVVFFHGGRAGIEPESSHRYALPGTTKPRWPNFRTCNLSSGMRVPVTVRR